MHETNMTKDKENMDPYLKKIKLEKMISENEIEKALNDLFLYAEA